MNRALYRTDKVEPGIWQITDVLDDRAYLVVGQHEALLVDTTMGYGNLLTAVREITNLPLTVVLTHNHYDHSGGAGWFDEVLWPSDELALAERETERAMRVYDRLVGNAELDGSVPFALRDGESPRTSIVQEGDVFDLGGEMVEAVALPGHTTGSMGYVVQGQQVLLSGDAVTPIMCLFLEESLDIAAYRKTLAKMAGMDFQRFYTGHHDVPFAKESLASFDACAEFASKDLGMPWRHTMLPEYVGTVHLAPCETEDVDSPDFRALIGPYVPRYKKRAHPRR